MSNIAIEFNHVGKQYRLGTIGTGTISHDLNRWWARIRGKEDPFLKIGEVNDRTQKASSDFVWALKDIDFKVEQGDVLGIIGKNGAGKSTLLKVLSRVTSPTSGSIRARGRIASLLEVGTGFHPEMTGRENIYMNGSIMGMTKAEITRKLDEIVDFAGVEKYIDTPVKRYSSGMTVRLGFAIAAHLEPEILVVDEVLAVGDAEFQKKAIGKMQDISQGGGRTVLFVSHNMNAIRSLCLHGIVLKNGHMDFNGTSEKAIEHYLTTEETSTHHHNNNSKSPVFISDAFVCDDNGIESGLFDTSQHVNLKLKLCHKEQLPLTHLLVTILDRGQTRLSSFDIVINGDTDFTIQVDKDFLARGYYSFMTHIYQPGIAPYEVNTGICHFEIINSYSMFTHLETFDYGRILPRIKIIEHYHSRPFNSNDL